jgi:peptidoglycan glycosyltransferase
MGARRRGAVTRTARSRRAAARQRASRRLALAVVAAVAAGVGYLLAGQGSPAARLALAYARAWAAGRYQAAYQLLAPADRRQLSEQRFAQSCEAALRTATAYRARVGKTAVAGKGRTYLVKAAVETRLFGVLEERFALPVVFEAGKPFIAYSGSVLFPGVPVGATLRRETELPPRAAILAREGTPLAEGERPPALGEGPRFSPLGAPAAAVAGSVAPLADLPQQRRAELEAEGVPPEGMVGVSGLELYFDRRLRGQPGGRLVAGKKVLATAQPKSGEALHTTISPAVQKAAVEGLGNRLGGVVALNPKTGEVLAVAGLGADVLQPPGSTFKIITASAALEAHLVGLETSFPYRTATVLEGYKLENAGGESCGGTLIEAFAVSCNSVFVPLGVEIGAKRLVAMAEAYGFNHPLPFPGALTSTIPPANEIKGEVELGSSAIGQGKVLASPLQMALAAATVANGGIEPTPTIEPQPHPQGHRVIKPQTAAAVATLMRAVVTVGIGGAAAIPGVEVAGKTGTAELGSNPCGGAPEGGGGEGKGEGCAAAERQNTDAWFAAFAPLHHPQIAVGVLVVRDGYGGETAAPVARKVIEAALGL